MAAPVAIVVVGPLPGGQPHQAGGAGMHGWEAFALAVVLMRIFCLQRAAAAPAGDAGANAISRAIAARE